MFFTAAADKEVDKELVLRRSLGVWNGDQFPADQIADEALADSMNIIPGTWRQRKGMKTRYLANVVGTGGVKGLHSYQKHDGTKEILFAVDGTVYKGTDGIEVETGLADKPFQFATYLDKVYYVNGADGLREYDGTTAGAVTPYTPEAEEPANYLADAEHAIHHSQYIAVHDHVLYLAAPKEHPHRLYRSDEVHGTGYFHNYVDVVSKFGGEIVGIVPFRGSLIILKSDSIWAADGLIGDASFALKQLHASTGCASGRTAVDVPALGLVFLGSDGHWYVLRPDAVNTENVPLYRLSSHITDTVKNLSRAYLHTASAGLVNSLYVCSVPTGTATTPNEAWVFDPTQVRTLEDDPTSLFVPWGPYTEPKASVFVEHDTGAVRIFLCGDYKTGMVYQLDVGTTDDGEAIVSSFDTKKFSFGYANRNKFQSSLYVIANREMNDSKLQTWVSCDDAEWWPLDLVHLLGENEIWDGAGVWTYDPADVWGRVKQGNNPTKIYVNKPGQQFQYRFEQGVLGGSMSIFEIRLRYTIGEVR